MSTTPITRPAGASGKLESAHPLSPLQKGMLFHSLYAPESGVYVEQLCCELFGRLDTAASPAIRRLAKRLRSSIERELGVTPRSAPAEPPGALSSTPEARQ